MKTFSLNSVAVLVLGSIAVSAWAEGDAQIRPWPPNVRSVESPASSTAAEVAQTVVRTPYGDVRMRADATDATERPEVNAPQSQLVSGRDGQVLRVVPDAEPADPGLKATAAAGAGAMPEGVLVIESGNVKMLQMWNAADALQLPAEATPIPAGMRIVDLPPGALGPAGMPEPMTLYRVATGPEATQALPVEPE